MKIRKIVLALYSLLTISSLFAQEVTGLQAAIWELSKEGDPRRAVLRKVQIISEYGLTSSKDAETIDLLNGTVAMAYVMKKDYPGFERYIDSIRNKFNQTSMLSMAANKLLDGEVDAAYAHRLAKQTLDKYHAFKDDPSAKPAGYTKGDWDRFMSFAQYPYYDTYAKALFALKRYKEALHYQELAFNSKPEEGIPPSVERYAKLLQLTGDEEGAKQFLLKVAAKGKLNKNMIAQLESFYANERGSGANFSGYLDSLQNSIQAETIAALKKEMLNEPAPSFSLLDINGKQVQLADFKGKIVVLDLWATWCVPCIASFPAMQKEVEKNPDVKFLFIAVDEKGPNAAERVKSFITKKGYPFHVLMDEPVSKGSDQHKITSAYKPDGIPAKYFIDASGKLRFKTKGFDTDSELINEIDAIITILKTL